MNQEYTRITKNEYDLIFRCIYDKYRLYCKQWLEGVEHKLNLKNLQIRDIYNPKADLSKILADQFESYMFSFRNELSTLSMTIHINLEQEFKISKKIKFTYRVKTEESIMNKIYRKMKTSDGSFSINKYLNDLLGLRIIDPYYKENIDYIKCLLDSYKDIGFNVIHKDRSNMGYKAYHIYFKESNNTFPLEIQLWDIENENNNIEAHNVYKQEYLDTIIRNYNNF